MTTTTTTRSTTTTLMLNSEEVRCKKDGCHIGGMPEWLFSISPDRRYLRIRCHRCRQEQVLDLATLKVC